MCSPFFRADTQVCPYFGSMTVNENLEFGVYTPKAKSKKAANLDFVFQHFPRLKERKKQRAGSLSGGEQEMLAIGRGLLAAPKMLLLDEPSLGLAPLVVKDLFNTLEQIAALAGFASGLDGCARNPACADPRYFGDRPAASLCRRPGRSPDRGLWRLRRRWRDRDDDPLARAQARRGGGEAAGVGHGEAEHRPGPPGVEAYVRRHRLYLGT